MAYKLKEPYNTKIKADVAQLMCLREAIAKSRYGVFLQQRIGKTRVAVDFIGYNIARGARKVLVMCPVSAEKGWQVQIPQWMGGTGVEVIYGRMDGTQQTLPYHKDKATIIVCTYSKATYEYKYTDEMGIEHVIPTEKKFLKWQPDVVIFDEAHELRKHTSDKSRFAYKISRNAPYVLGLTGTPYGNRCYADVFGLFRAINPILFGTKWREFTDKYCTMGGYKGYDVVGYKNEEELLKIVADNSFREIRENVMFEPEVFVDTIKVTLSDKERDAYDRFKEDEVLFLESQPVVTSAMVAVTRYKLQQLAAGAIIKDVDEFGNAQGTLRIGESKARACRNFVLPRIRSGKSTVIVFKYSADAEILRQLFGDKCRTIVGKVNKVKREGVIKNFMCGDFLVLLAQEMTIATGLDLGIANTMIFYTWSEDSILHRQVKDRIMGRGQKDVEVFYKYMCSENTVDTKLYKDLNKKISKAEKAANWREFI